MDLLGKRSKDRSKQALMNCVEQDIKEMMLAVEDTKDRLR